MDGKQHLLTTSIIVVLLILLLPIDDWITKKQQIILVFSILLFSSLITPDIDLKLPLISHRGLTHNPMTIIILFVLLSIVLYFVLNTYKFTEYANYVPFLALGATIGCVLHVIEDKFFPKQQTFIWVLLFVFTAIAFIVSK